MPLGNKWHPKGWTLAGNTDPSKWSSENVIPAIRFRKEDSLDRKDPETSLSLEYKTPTEPLFPCFSRYRQFWTTSVYAWWQHDVRRRFLLTIQSKQTRAPYSITKKSTDLSFVHRSSRPHPPVGPRRSTTTWVRTGSDPMGHGMRRSLCS